MASGCPPTHSRGGSGKLNPSPASLPSPGSPVWGGLASDKGYNPNLSAQVRLTGEADTGTEFSFNVKKKKKSTN